MNEQQNGGTGRTERPTPSGTPQGDRVNLLKVSDPFAHEEYADSFFAEVGGHETFVRLVDVFYEGVARDELLRPMYPEEDLEPAKRRLLMFLEQYWGGPDTYGQERGHPRLRMRHHPFKVTPAARDRWLLHMRDGVRALALPPLQEATLWDYLERAAHSLVNSFEE